MKSKAFAVTDIVGKKFGLLTVVSYKRAIRTKNYKQFKHFYDCLCECGNIVEKQRSNLIIGHTTSCGCLKKRTGDKNPCWTGHGEISSAFWFHIKRHAETRKLPFEVTIEEAWEQFLKQNKSCIFTGVQLDMHWTKKPGIKNKEKRLKRTASLDRVDSSKGYTKDNIQWVHKKINWIKCSMSNQELISICNSVTKFQNKLKKERKNVC